jgi:hypothetical protein
MISGLEPRLLETLVLRSSTRLAAGTLVLALPLAAAAGCGVEKKRSVKAEFASAQSNLSNSKAASFTLRLEDGKGNVEKLATQDDAAPKEVVSALLGASVTYTVDPASDATLKSIVVKGSAPLKLSEQLKKTNAAFVVRDSTATVAELRLVAGVLYARVDLAEIGRLAKAGGVKDFDGQLDDFVNQADPKLATGLKEVRAGKWVTLPIADYLQKFQDLAKSFTGGLTGEPGTKATPSPQEYSDLGKKLFAAVKPYVKVTDANDSSSKRVLDVDVKARPAVKAALALLQTEKGLPFAGFLKGVTPADVDSNLASIRTLDPKAGKDSLAGSSVVLDVDDSADQVTAPTDLAAFDLGALIDSFLGQLQVPGQLEG